MCSLQSTLVANANNHVVLESPITGAPPIIETTQTFVRFASKCAMAGALHPPTPPTPVPPVTAQRCQPREHCDEPRRMGDGMFECVGTTALCQRCELGFHGESCEPVECAPLHVAHAQIDCPVRNRTTAHSALYMPHNRPPPLLLLLPRAADPSIISERVLALVYTGCVWWSGDLRLPVPCDL